MKKWFGFLFLIMLWQCSAMIIDNRIFPEFFEVVSAFAMNGKIILTHTYYSMFRLIAGVLLSVAVGMPVGILIGYHRKLSELLSPVIYLLAPVPKIALLPLIMLIFGIGDWSKIFIIFIIMLFQVVVAAHDSVRNIPQEYLIPLQTIRAGHIPMLVHVIFPAAIPEMFTSIRIGLATGISVLFFAETFGTKWGLGFYIMDMWMRLDYQQMYAGILLLGLLGLFSVTLLNQLQVKFCPWLVSSPSVHHSFSKSK